jgi:hypothetical protein
MRKQQTLIYINMSNTTVYLKKINFILVLEQLEISVYTYHTINLNLII